MKRLILVIGALVLAGCGGGSSAPKNASTAISSTNSVSQTHIGDTAVLTAEPMKHYAPAPTAFVKTFTGKRSEYKINRLISGNTVREIANGAITPIVGVTSLKFSDMSVNMLIGDNANTIPITSLNAIIDLYVAFFNRVPDADGLNYWIDRRKAGMTLDDIAESFFSAAQEYPLQTGYKVGMSDADFIRVIYQNVLGRIGVTAPTDDEVAYWVNDLRKGATKSHTIAVMMTAAREFSQDVKWGWVTTLLNNKVAVSRYFAIEQGITFNTPEETIVKTIAIVSKITDKDTSVARAIIGITDVNFNLTLPATAVEAITPIPVQASSYLNKTMISLTDPTIPIAYTLGLEKWIGDKFYGLFEFKTLVFADFLQIGEPVAFAVQRGYSNYAKTNKKFPDIASRVVFLQKKNNVWSDVTNLLLDEADRYVCKGPADSLVADFNNDGKPDLFMGCTGGDIEQNVWDAASSELRNELLSEYQYIFLSQPNGKYKVSKTSKKFYGHGSTAGDVNGDGLVDVVVADARWGVGSILITLINKGNGTFDFNYDLFDIKDKAIFFTELVDLGRGVLDLVVGSTPALMQYPSSMQNVIIRNRSGNYRPPYDVLPNFTSKKSGLLYDGIMGLIVKDGSLYLSRIGNDHKDYAIQKIKLSDMSSAVVWEKTTVFSDAWDGSIDYGSANNLYKMSNGDIVPMMPCVFARTDVKFPTSICGIKVQ